MENIKYKICLLYFEYKLRIINNEIDRLNAKSNILNEFYLKNKTNTNLNSQTQGNLDIIKKIDQIFEELKDLVAKKLNFLNIIIFCKKQYKEESTFEFNVKDISHYVVKKNLFELLDIMENREHYEECDTILSEIQLFKKNAA